MENKKFQKRKENFTCLICHNKVIGNGYTDHCPNCLWSIHTDINPGDRRADCKGLLKPISVKIKSGKEIIYYKCTKCNYSYKVKADTNDNFEVIKKLISHPIID